MRVLGTGKREKMTEEGDVCNLMMSCLSLRRQILAKPPIPRLDGDDRGTGVDLASR